MVARTTKGKFLEGKMEFQFSLRDHDDKEIQNGVLKIETKEKAIQILEQKFSADDIFWLSSICGVNRFGLSRYDKPLQFVCIW